MSEVVHSIFAYRGINSLALVLYSFHNVSKGPWHLLVGPVLQITPLDKVWGAQVRRMGYPLNGEWLTSGRDDDDPCLELRSEPFFCQDRCMGSGPTLLKLYLNKGTWAQPFYITVAFFEVHQVTKVQYRRSLPIRSP